MSTDRAANVPGERPVSTEGAVAGEHHYMVPRPHDQEVFGASPPASRQQVEELLFRPVLNTRSALVSSWLRPDAGVVAPQPRPELDEIVAWLRSEARPVARLVCGDSGQGKTFLAHQVCRTMRDAGWSAGFIRLPLLTWRSLTLAETTGQLRQLLEQVPRFMAALSTIPMVGGRWLLVVDDAETAAPIVKDLLGSIVDAGAVDMVRLVLLARSDGAWWQELSGDHPRRELIDPTPIRLRSLAEELPPQRVEQIWGEAQAAFAAQVHQHQYPIKELDVTSPESVATTLDLYADALLRVLNSTGSTASVAGDPVAQVWTHEMRQVAFHLATADVVLSPGQVDWAVAAVALRPASTLSEATAALGEVRALRELPPPQRERLAQTLVELYPGDTGEQGWAPPQPDRLIDTHLITLASQAASQQEWLTDIAALVGTDRPEIAVQAATVLHRCLSSTPGPQMGKDRIRAALTWLITNYPAGYAPVLSLIAPQEFDDVIITAVGDERYATDALIQFDRLLRGVGFAAVRSRITAAVSHRLEAATHPKPDAAEEQPAQRAAELHALSIRLSQEGSPQEALAACQEAVALYRQLATDNPTPHLPNLAAALANLALQLSDLDRTQEAITAAEEALTIYRRLTPDAPPTYLPHLAAALIELTDYLSDLERPQQALAAAQEVVTIYRRLAADAPTTYLPALANELKTLSSHLDRAERRKEAAAALQESVSVYRNLSQDSPADFLYFLASTLINLSDALTEIGHRQEALTAVEEAVATYRHLASNDPMYLSDLAATLNRFSFHLSAAGNLEKSLTAIEEAAAIYRRLASDNPAYLPNLAATLINLSDSLNKVGRQHESLTLGRETIAIYQKLAINNPVYRAPLTWALDYFSIQLSEPGDPQESLTAIEEAVANYRRLAADNPNLLPILGATLINLSYSLDKAGRHQESLTTIQEAVSIYRNLAQVKPTAYLPTLATALNNLSIQLSTTGHHQEALTARQEAVTIYRRLAADSPSIYLPNLATTLAGLAHCSAKTDHHQEALAAIEEAVSLSRDLTITNPETFTPSFFRSLAELTLLLESTGNTSRAQKIREEITAIVKQLRAQ